MFQYLAKILLVLLAIAGIVSHAQAHGTPGHVDNAATIRWEQDGVENGNTNHNHLFAHSFTNGDGTTTHDHDAFSAWRDRTLDLTNPYAHGFITENVAQPRYKFQATAWKADVTVLGAAAQTIVNDALDAWETAAHAAGPALAGRRTGIDFDNDQTNFEFSIVFVDELIECRGAIGEWWFSDSQRQRDGDGSAACSVAEDDVFTNIQAADLPVLVFDDDTAWDFSKGVGEAGAIPANTIDFATIALHETGHVIGLLHTPGDPAGHIMKASGVAIQRTIEGDSAFGAAELYTVVPEPAAMTLLVLTGGLVLVNRRSRIE